MVTIKVSDLLKMAQELMSEGYEYVDVEELEEDDDLPKCLHFEAYDGHGGGVDFDGIDHIKVSAFYKDDEE